MKPKIIYMGTPEFAVAGLKKLIEHDYPIVAVVTATDKIAGRGNQLNQSAVKKFAIEKNIPVLQPEKLRDPEFLEKLQSFEADLQVVVAFRMLPKQVWNMPKWGTFNLHASLLPDFRGAAPINWALANGVKETGVTTFFINEEIDTGNILLQEKIQVPLEWNVEQLHDVLMDLGANLILKTVQGLENQTIIAKPQETLENMRPAPKLTSENTRIDWNKPAEELYHFIRAFSPYPSAWTTLNGIKFKIFETNIEYEKKLKPGEIQADKKHLWVGTGSVALEIKQLQAEAKKKMDTVSFLNGTKIPDASFFE